MKLANGYGSVYKLSGKRRKKWIVRLPYSEESRINGEKRKILGYYSTKTEALNALMEYHKNPDIYLNRETTLRKVYEIWSPIHYKKLNPGTVDMYEYTYKNLTPLLDIPINEIRLYHLQNFIDGVKPVLAKKSKILLGLLFDYAVMNDMCVKSYVKGIVLPEVKQQVIRTNYTREEIDRLWECSDNLNAKYSLIQLYTGMRVSEVTQMKKENVHIDERYMIGGLKTKAGRDRTIPICKKILPVIKDLYDNCTTDRLLNDYRCKQSVCNAIKKYNKEIGIERHGTHDCRYTFVSLMEELGVPLLTTQKIIGHSAKNLTQDLYTKIDLDNLLEAVDKLE